MVWRLECWTRNGVIQIIIQSDFRPVTFSEPNLPHSHVCEDTEGSEVSCKPPGHNCNYSTTNNKCGEFLCQIVPKVLLLLLIGRAANL